MIARVVIVTIFSALFSILFMVAPIWFGMTSFPVLAVPMILTYGVFFQAPMESAFVALLLGLSLDIIAANPIGVYGIACLLMWIAAKIVSLRLGRVQPIALFGFILLLSITFRGWLTIALPIFGNHKTNVDWFSFLVGPIFDGMFGIFAIKVLHHSLVFFKLAEPTDDVVQRLQARRILR